MTKAEFIKMIEKKIDESDDINSAPFGMDNNESGCFLNGKVSGLQWVLEMLGAVE